VVQLAQWLKLYLQYELQSGFVANYLDTTLDKLPKPGENTDCTWKGVPVNPYPLLK